MTGQIGWSPDGLKDEQWDKRDQNPGEEKPEFPRHTDHNVPQTRLTIPPMATHQTAQTPHNATVAKHGLRRNSAGEKTDQS